MAPVALDQAAAIGTAQAAFENPLYPRLALAIVIDKAEHVTGAARVRVEALHRIVEQDPCQLLLLQKLRQAGRHVVVQLPHERLELAARVLFGHRKDLLARLFADRICDHVREPRGVTLADVLVVIERAERLRLEAVGVCQTTHADVDVAQDVAVRLQILSRKIIHQQLAVDVEDPTAVGRQYDRVAALPHRPLRILVVLGDLHVDEPCR